MVDPCGGMFKEVYCLKSSEMVNVFVSVKKTIKFYYLRSGEG
jgi:hypothetical protein